MQAQEVGSQQREKTHPEFSNGSWEAGHAGLEEVVVDTSDGGCEVLSGQVPEALIAKWKRTGCRETRMSD